MDAAEKNAEELLRSEGFKSIMHEPNGKSTYPDFTIDGTIAVEVRRLDQHHVVHGEPEDLQDAFFRVRHRMEKLCEELGQADGASWFICYSFARPMLPWKLLIPKLETALRLFMASADKNDSTLYEDTHFKLDVVAAPDRLESFFRLGVMHDRQSGGFVVAEFIRNIKRCAKLKAEKKAQCKVKYEQSWLVLVNTSGFKLAGYDQQQLLENIERPPEWDRVIVLAATTTGEWFEI